MSIEFATIEQVLATTDFPADAQRELLDAMSTQDDGEGLRATYLHPLPDVVERHGGAEARSRYDGTVQPLPTRAPFAFLPIPELVVHLAVAADVLGLEGSLEIATNAAMALHIAALRQHNSLRMLLTAGGDGLFEYLDLVTESSAHFYNFGNRQNRRIGRHHLAIEFSDYPVALSRYWVIGLNQGLLSLFRQEGEVSLEQGDATDRFTLHVRLGDSSDGVS